MNFQWVSKELHQRLKGVVSEGRLCATEGPRRAQGLFSGIIFLIFPRIKLGQKFIMTYIPT